MTVAARLAENSALRILLIEAGADDRTNPQIYDIYQYSAVFGGPLDWKWTTDQGKTIHGGKTLGGSTSINGAAWTRGTTAQYDALSSVLLPTEASIGWNSTSMFTYMNKAETFSGPNAQQSAKGAQSVSSFHGFNGPIQTTFPDLMYGGPQQGAFVSTIQNLTGISQCQDICGGVANCVAYTPNVRLSSQCLSFCLTG